MASKQQYKEDEKRRKKAKMKEEAEAAAGNDKDEDVDYHTSEDAGDRSSLDPSFEPSRRELREADREGDQ